VTAVMAVMLMIIFVPQDMTETMMMILLAVIDGIAVLTANVVFAVRQIEIL